MEEVIEELRELAQDISLPLDLPTEDELVLVEEQILIQLPYDLRVFLLEVSDIVYGSVEPVTAADPRSHTFLPEVASKAWDLGVPREFIPICEYGGGYACAAEDGEIFFYRGDQVSDKSWENIWQWSREVWMSC